MDESFPGRNAEVAKDLRICKETLRNWAKASTGMSTGQADRQTSIVNYR